jgi:hypothetical protein
MPTLDAIPFHIDFHTLLDKLRIKEHSPHASQLNDLAREAEAIARPKATYRVSFVEARGDDWVVVDSIKFSSRLLRVNLNDVHRLFPYVATCGVELEAWSTSNEDFLFRFWADTIKHMAVNQASEAMRQDLVARFQPGPLSSMNPGSLGDFPITAQTDLFALLGDVETLIGVQLTSSFLMLPTKSVSGILFPTEQSFFSCQLCPREQCPSRKAPYEAQLWQTKYT